MSKAVHALKSERRWVVTGTPIQNSMKDMFSIISFLKLEPFTDRQWWRRTMERPISEGDQSALRYGKIVSTWLISWGTVYLLSTSVFYCYTIRHFSSLPCERFSSLWLVVVRDFCNSSLSSNVKTKMTFDRIYETVPFLSVVCSYLWEALQWGVPRHNKWMVNHSWNYRTDRFMCSLLSCLLKRGSCTTPWLKRGNSSLASKWLSCCVVFCFMLGYLLRRESWTTPRQNKKHLPSF